MARRVVAAAALLASAAFAGCDTAEQVSPSRGGPVSFGINAQALQILPSNDRVGEMERHLDVIAALGMQFVRANLDWRLIQPTAPAGPATERFDWSANDVWVEALAARGLRWQPTVQAAATPDWAIDGEARASGCGSNSPPRSPADYANLLRALAGRYGSGGRFWEENPSLPYEPIGDYELTNEPNFDRFWCPQPDPAAWARLVLLAGRAVHAADREGRVVSGGLAPFRQRDAREPHTIAADRFLRRALRAEPGLARQIDVVAVHPYGSTPADATATLRWFRRIVDATSLRGKPLSVNEFGWTTSGDDGPVVADESVRTSFVAEATPALASVECGVVALAMHAWTSPEDDPENAEHWYGVAEDRFGEPYPTALAYAGQAARLSRREPPPDGAPGPAARRGPSVPTCGP